MNIQYVGFRVDAISRFYDFHVIDSPSSGRKFTLEVKCDAFQSSRLRFQDGPSLCLARLRHELESETQLSPAHAVMHIGEQDIAVYLEEHYPPSRPRAHRKGVRH